MKKLGILMILLTTVVILAACGNEEAENLNDEQNQTESLGEEQADTVDIGSDNEPNEIPEVTDDDLADIPEDALVIPIDELHEHDDFYWLLEEDGQWMLCHLTGDCTNGVMQFDDGNGAWIHISEDILSFQIEIDRVFMPIIEEKVYECRTNDRNNLLICEETGLGGSDGMLVISDNTGDLDLMQEMTTRLTAETTFEIWYVDGRSDPIISLGTRNDLEELVEGTSTSYSLGIKHEEVNGELVATHILIMKFPW